jgi:hypothetical protein
MSKKIGIDKASRDNPDLARPVWPYTENELLEGMTPYNAHADILPQLVRTEYLINEPAKDKEQ